MTRDEMLSLLDFGKQINALCQGMNSPPAELVRRMNVSNTLVKHVWMWFALLGSELLHLFWKFCQILGRIKIETARPCSNATPNFLFVISGQSFYSSDFYCQTANAVRRTVLPNNMRNQELAP